MMQESAAPVQQEAAAPQNEAPKAPVHVVKAGETDKLDVSLFENPFDNAFESEISELEKVSGYDFKPLDDIFSFGGADDKLQQTSGGYTDEGTAGEDSSDKDDKAYTEPAVDTGFAGEFAKADYSIRHSVTPKSNYAANMYRHTVETTQTPAEDFPDAQQSGEHLTQDDFDILPSSPSLTVPVGEKASVKAKSEEKPAVSEKHAPPVIKLDAPSVDSLTDADDIPGADRRRRDNGGTMNRNTAKRLLDGIIKPTKIRNPFIDENDDE